MTLTSRKYVIIGLICGAIWSLIVALLVKLDIEGLQAVTNFFSSVPVYISLKFGLSELVSTIIFFGYWVLAGGVLGWSIGVKGIPGVIPVILIVVLVALHLYCQREAGNIISEALKGLGDVFTGVTQ